MLLVIGEGDSSLFWQVALEVCNAKKELIVYADVTADIRALIKQHAPKCILLLGNNAAKLFDLSKEQRSQKIETTAGKNKVTLLNTYSPGYVHYNAAAIKTFAQDINTAWSVTIDRTEEPSPTVVKMCTTIAEVKQVIKYVLQTKQCVFDFESTDLTDLGIYDPEFKTTLVAISFQHGSAYSIPLYHRDSPFSDAQVTTIFRLLSKYIWNNPEIHKINQNIKFDMGVAARMGYPDFKGRCDCTMVMHSLYDDLTKHSIKEWIPQFFPQFLGWEMQLGKGKHKYANAELPALSKYAGIDADAAFRGYTILTKKLMEDPRLYELYRNLYAFVLKPLLHMEMRGLPINRAEILKHESRAEELTKEQTAILNKYQAVRQFKIAERKTVTDAKIAELTARQATLKGKNLEKNKQLIADIKNGAVSVYKGFNFGSPDQLNKLLYSKQGFGFKAIYNKAAKGIKEATGSEIIKQLGDKTGFVNDLLVLRSLKTINSKYLKGIRVKLDSNDYIHTVYNQANVKTGRLSSGGKKSGGPNMQNIITHVKIHHPFVEELTILPKKSFIPPVGYAIAEVDFSQIELRIMAEFAKEPKMLQAYADNLDLHILTACAISNVSMDEFMKLPEAQRDELRQKAKSANFGLIYGQEAPGFQEYARDKYGVNMTLQEATKVRDKFFQTYPAILDYHAHYIAKCKQFGHIRTLFGRRAHYPDVNSHDQFKRGNAERELINCPIQGTNAENTNFALALLEHRLPSCVLLANTVHDSIMFFAPIRLMPYAIETVLHTCENVPQLRFFGKELKHVKIKAEAKVSLTNWKDLRKYSRESWDKMVAEIK